MARSDITCLPQNLAVKPRHKHTFWSQQMSVLILQHNQVDSWTFHMPWQNTNWLMSELCVWQIILLSIFNHSVWQTILLSIHNHSALEINLSPLHERILYQKMWNQVSLFHQSHPGCVYKSVYVHTPSTGRRVCQTDPSLAPCECSGQQAEPTCGHTGTGRKEKCYLNQ